MFERHRHQPGHHPEIHTGMTVFSADGFRLGRVVGTDEGGFVIERGAFFAQEKRTRLDEVKEVTDSEVYLARSRDTLLRETREAGGVGQGPLDLESRVEAAELRDRSGMGGHFGENASPLPGTVAPGERETDLTGSPGGHPGSPPAGGGYRH